MENHNSSPSAQENAAAASANALRGLQERAHAALTSSRMRAARLEAEINQQLDAIAATLGEQIALESQSSVEADAFLAEVARLTEELEQSRPAWRAERSDLESQRDAISQKLASAEAARYELAQKLTELEVDREVLAQRVAKLAAQTDDISPKLSTLETEREDLAHQLSGLEAEKAAL